MSGARKSVVLLFAMVHGGCLGDGHGHGLGAEQQPTSASSGVSALEAAMLANVNQIRAQHGLRTLSSTRLSGAADQQSKAMGTKGLLSHNSADGTAFWKRIRRYYTDRNYRYWSVARTCSGRLPTSTPRRRSTCG